MIVSIVFWGCIGLAIVLSACGLVRRSPALLFLATAFTLPLALYCAATPRFRAWGLLIPVPQLLSGFVVRRYLWLAVVLGSVFAVFVAWLKILILGSTQNAAA